MTNEQKMNEQLSQLADVIKGMFTEEELKQMEESFNVFKQLKEEEQKESTTNPKS
jgi:hypothetical protein